MSDLADTTTGRPAADAGLPLTGDPQESGEGEGTTNRGASQHLKRVMSPLGWVGVVLFVVGVIVIGIAIGVSQGGNTAESAVSGGSLGPVSELVADEIVGPNAIIGEVTITETVAVFSEPQGSSIARVDAGTYGLLDSKPGWVRVVLGGPNTDGLHVTGWVQASPSVTAVTG